MKKRGVILILLAMMLGAMIGCGKKPVENTNESAVAREATKEVRFMWWGSDARHAATVEAMKLFESRNPNVKLQAEYSGFSGYFDKLTTQLSAKTGPDLVQLSYTNVADYVTFGQLLPLDPFIEKGLISVENLSEATLDMYRFDGKLYAIPSGVSTTLLFYNKDMFDAAGVAYPNESWTWNEYIETAKKLTKDTNGDGKVDIWGTGEMVKVAGIDMSFKKYLYERNGSLWSDDLSKVAFNSDAGIAALEFIKSFQTMGIIPPIEMTAANPDGVDDFQLGRVAMYIASSPNTMMYQEAVPNLGIERVPAGIEKDVFWVNPSMMYSITKDAKDPELTASLLNFMVNDEEAGSILKIVRGTPSNSVIRANIGRSLSEIEQTMLACIQKTTSTDFVNEPFPAGFMEIFTLVDREIQNYLFGKYKNAQETLSILETESNKILARYI